MNPVAFGSFKLVVVARSYGAFGKIDEIKVVCDKHGALIVEDEAGSIFWLLALRTKAFKLDLQY